MTSRPRWLLERLTFLLLCFCTAAAYHLWQTLQPGHPATAATSVMNGPLYRHVGHLHFDSAPLEQVLNELSRQTGQKIVVDWDDLEEHWGVVPHADVTLHVDNVTLLTALNKTFYHAALTPLHLAVNSRGEITVSTDDGATKPAPPVVKPARLFVRDYDVDDLLEPFSTVVEVRPLWQSGGVFGSVFLDATTERGRAINYLAAVIDNRFRQDPSSFARPLSIQPLAGRLVVLGTADDHERVSALLRALRAAAKLNPDDPPPSGPR